METDDDHATMRESFPLVQIIFFIGYTNVLPAHQQENMVEKQWENMQFVLVFDSGLWRDLLLSLWSIAHDWFIQTGTGPSKAIRFFEGCHTIIGGEAEKIAQTKNWY